MRSTDEKTTTSAGRAGRGRLSVLPAVLALGLGTTLLAACGSSGTTAAGAGASTAASATTAPPATTAAPSSAAPTVPVSSTHPAAPRTPASSPSAGHIPTCSATEFPTGTWTMVPGSAGAGSVSADISFRNASAHTCVIGDFPQSVKLHTAGGALLPSSLTDLVDVPSAGIFVSPGSWVHTEIRYSPDIPSGSEPQSGPCEADAARADVLLAEASTPSHVTIATPGPVCGGGAITVKPWEPGQNSPAGG